MAQATKQSQVHHEQCAKRVAAFFWLFSWLKAPSAHLKTRWAGVSGTGDKLIGSSHPRNQEHGGYLEVWKTSSSKVLPWTDNLSVPCVLRLSQSLALLLICTAQTKEICRTTSITNLIRLLWTFCRLQMVV